MGVYTQTNLLMWMSYNSICYSIENSRTGLDTSKNQCSAPAVPNGPKKIDGIMSTIYFE